MFPCDPGLGSIFSSFASIFQMPSVSTLVAWASSNTFWDTAMAIADQWHSELNLVSWDICGTKNTNISCHGEPFAWLWEMNGKLRASPMLAAN
jgi:hypothetical protein